MKDKLYVLFEPHERVDLVFSALSRKDFDEVAKLTRSCPERKYKAMDLHVKQPFEDLEAILSLFCIMCLSYCNIILLTRMDLIAIISVMDFDEQKLKSADVDLGIDLIRKMQDHLDIINFKQDSILRDISYIKSAYKALGLFFELIDVNYEHITKWINIPSIDEIPIGADKKYLSQVTHTDEFVDEIKDLLMSFWRGPKRSS